jgi:uncharacterized protein
MNQPAKAQEPSMEEILASIRRIIADDEPQKPAAPAAPPASKPVAAAAAPAPMRPAALPPAPPPPPRPAVTKSDIDAALASIGRPPEARPDPDVLDLTESMAQEATRVETPANFRTIDGHPDVIFTEQAEPEEPRANSVDEARRQFTQAMGERPLLSSTTSSVVDSAFNTLAQTVLVQNARTLEDLVREMLRPLLKTWLDDNLPGLVERLVRAEIERVSRGRTG